jgi:hypothetical protein
MSIPAVNMTIEDGALGTLPPNVARASVKLGICSKGVPNVLAGGFSDVNTLTAALGQGPLVEAIAQVLAVAGGPVYAMPVTASVVGTVGAVTHTGPGSGTVTPSKAPDRVIVAKVTTGGTVGTMAVSFSVDGGAYSTPVVSGVAPWAYPVPGTQSTLTFAAGTYVLNDLYTVGTNGAVVLTGAGPATVTQASNPVDAYSVLVTIVTGGGLGAGAFTYSVDGGNSQSPTIAIPGSGVYTIPGTGIVLTFAGTFTLDDTYAFASTAAGYGTSDLTAALVALRANATEWGFVHAVGAPASAAAAAALAAIMDTQMTAAEVAFRYAWGMIECPTSESDATVLAAFTSFSSARTMVCAGDADVISPLSGRILRRNAAWPVSARIAFINAGEDPAWVGRGPLKNVHELYRDEAATQLLDEGRFTTLRSHIGKAGYFITNGRMMAPGGSDFTYVQYRRVMDRACQVTRAAELEYLNADVRLDEDTGYIDERDAQSFEGDVNAKLRAAVVSTGDASGCSVVMSRTTNLLATAAQPVTVRVTPKAYLKQIDTSIGFKNPALAA